MAPSDLPPRGFLIGVRIACGVVQVAVLSAMFAKLPLYWCLIAWAGFVIAERFDCHAAADLKKIKSLPTEDR